MDVVYRPARPEEAVRLHEIRRRSILELAPPKMPLADAQAWARRLTLAGMELKLRELEVWVAEWETAPIAWGAVCGNRLEALYVAAAFAGQGVGVALLDLLERLVHERGLPSVHLEASSNARGFYLRRGYRPNGAQTLQGAWPMLKDYSSPAEVGG